MYANTAVTATAHPAFSGSVNVITHDDIPEDSNAVAAAFTTW
ncbi:hypothetical protein [Pseudohongiella acticola]|nr:hypothetical protein [Pseudohongiella acticola]